ncbi:putative tail tubular protein B [Ralstonia phage RpY2]|uniref:Tail tubular protein B n=1 Tax=Ralstonia phage RpY2 TaxID=2880950 RepID=A0AC61TNI6_9CAUD|nr:putative tail tubular protein B [Ralstonia phage RpY2]
MPLVTQTIKNLKGGISQQPDILRFPDQGEAQINGFSSEVEGLQKRPPSVHVKRLTTFTPGLKPLVKLINRDEFERYFVSFLPGGYISIVDLDGNAKTVNTPNGTGYINSANPREDLRMVTVADYTFIINKKVTPALDGSVAYPGYRTNGQALVNVKGGQYSRTYSIEFNGGVQASYTTPDGSVAAHAAQIDTQYIAQQLGNQLVSNLGPSGWGVDVGPNYIFIQAPSSNSVWNLKIRDGFNNGLMTGCIFEVQRFNMLPAQARDGYIVKVLGDPGSGSDDYYARFDVGRGVWAECAAPGYQGTLAPWSMPHVLVREANGTFTFREQTWQVRPSGDIDSSPEPSFVGTPISDVFFFRNRLGVLAGENVILSASGEFFKFWPKSVVAAADTDPIDVAVSHSRVSILHHAVPFAEELLLWSDQTQFILKSDGILSTKTVKVDTATEFESSIDARPVAAGRGVYFAAPRASFTSIRRYYAVQDTSQVKNAEDISAHVPSYVPNGVFALGSSTTENVVTVLTEGATSRIYLYKYLYLQEQLAQQSWSHWDFGPGSEVLACEMVGAVMYLMINSPSGTYLESIEFTQNTKDYDFEPFRLHMDRKKQVETLTYNLATNRTVISLATEYGATPARGKYWVVTEDGRGYEFPEPETGWVAQGGTLEIPGDLTSKTMLIGEAYTFTYTMSKLLIKVADAQGVRSEDVGRLQIQRAWVNYNNSGPFTVDVCGKFLYTMSGKKLGAYVLGEDALDTGQFRFPVMTDSQRCRVTISSDNPGPVAMIGAGWIGRYFRREQAL